MIYNASTVADYFIAFSHEHGDLLTNLKLQKLLYYAQAWFLSLHERPLFKEDLQAWVHGPVVPEVYHRFKEATWKPILEDVSSPTLEPEVVEHLDEIMGQYGGMTAYQLERLTHQELPWINARKGFAPDEPSTAIISHVDMKTYYRSQLNG